MSRLYVKEIRSFFQKQQHQNQQLIRVINILVMKWMRILSNSTVRTFLRGVRKLYQNRYLHTTEAACTAATFSRQAYGCRLV